MMSSPKRKRKVQAEATEVLTIDELSTYLKIAKSTLYKLAQDGKLPGQKIGKHWRFRKATIDQWLSDDRHDHRN